MKKNILERKGSRKDINVATLSFIFFVNLYTYLILSIYMRAQIKPYIDKNDWEFISCLIYAYMYVQKVYQKTFLFTMTNFRFFSTKQTIIIFKDSVVGVR